MAFVLVDAFEVYSESAYAVGESSLEAQNHVPGQMEASFLVTLFKFVQWPSPGSSNLATICFLRSAGRPSVVQARLEFALKSHEKWTELPGRTIAVRALSRPEEIAGSESNPACQILYLDSRAATQFWPLHLSAPVLTVSDLKDFAYQGGMIQFIWDSQDTYRIAINPRNVTDSGLVVSGALGTLADRVDSARFAQ